VKDCLDHGVLSGICVEHCLVDIAIEPFHVKILSYESGPFTVNHIHQLFSIGLALTL
jgi:hypothetical protein